MSRKPQVCFLCGKESERVVWKEGSYEARDCTHCGLVYTTPEPSSGEVDRLIDSHPDSAYLLSAPYKAKWVSSFCPKGRLIEIGCGKGHFLSEIRRRGFDVFGLEPEQSKAREAESRYGLNVRQEFLEEYHGHGDRFEVVYHCDLLAHFDRPLESLVQMKSLLSQNGVLCFEIGLMAGITPLWYRYIGRIGLGPHLWFYSRRSLRLMLNKAGLEPVRFRFHGLIPRAVVGRMIEILVRRLVAPLLRVLSPLKVFPHASQVVGAGERIVCFLRYQIGALFPLVGPQTLFVIAKPAKSEVP